MAASPPPRRPCLLEPSEEDDHVYVADEAEQGLLVNNSSNDVESINQSSANLLDTSQDDANNGQPLTGYLRTFINFVKGNLGTGILAVPDAIKNAGLICGCVALVLIGLLSTFCCHLLLRAYRQVSADKARSYAQVIYLVFRRATNPHLNRLATPARYVIDTILISTQIGYCSVYILFCSRMIKEVIDSYQSNPEDHYSIIFYESVLAAFLVPYCFVTTLKALSIFNSFANIMTVGCILVVMQYVFRHLQPVSSVNWYPQDLEKIPLFFGTAMFTFESISLILPIENSMTDRTRFHGWNGLLSISMLFIISLYVTVGFFGYLAFGADTQMILSNMPKGVLMYQIVKLIYAVCIVISYNLQLYVPVQILMPGLKRHINQAWFNRFGEYFLRTFIVLITYFLALNIPCLEHMISLFGAFASSWLALILPPTLELVSCYHPGQQHRRTPWLFLKCGAIATFGLFGCVLGTTIALKSIINALSQPGGCST